MTPTADEEDPRLRTARELKARGEVAEAIVVLKPLVASKPNDSAAWFELWEALSIAGRKQEANAAFDRLARLKLTSAQYTHLSASKLRKAGRFKEAAESYRAASELEPSDEDLVLLAAEALMRAGRVDDAIAEFRKVAAKRQEDPLFLTYF